MDDLPHENCVFLYVICGDLHLMVPAIGVPSLVYAMHQYEKKNESRLTVVATQYRMASCFIYVVIQVQIYSSRCIDFLVHTLHWHSYKQFFFLSVTHIFWFGFTLCEL